MDIVIETDLIILLFTISISYCVTHSILPTYNKDNIIIIVSRSHCDSRENAVLIYHSAEQLIPKLEIKMETLYNTFLERLSPYINY